MNISFIGLFSLIKVITTKNFNQHSCELKQTCDTLQQSFSRNDIFKSCSIF